jgi:hypothetical protein
MGEGAVQEMGKHGELLRNENGLYARLVAAQRLRETRDAIDLDDVIGQSSGVPVEGPTDIEKAALEEIPLGRSNTHRSLASEILEQRKAQGGEEHEKEYSMFYLFRRMGRINKDEWKSYLFGCLFAIGQYLFWLCYLYCSSSVHSYRIGLSSFRHCLVCVQSHYCLSNDVELTILTQPWLSQASQTHPLRHAAMLVTATLFGGLSLCVTCSHHLQLDHNRRSFVVSILAGFSIGMQNYLFSASASSLSRKLRSLSLRAILRQDSKSDSQFLDIISSQLRS